MIDHDDSVRRCPCISRHGPRFIAIADAIDARFGDALESGNGVNAIDVEPWDYGHKIAASIRMRSGYRHAMLCPWDTTPNAVVESFVDWLDSRK